MTNRIMAPLFAAALACVLSSCQMRSGKQQSWSNPEFKNHTLGKTMVLAMADSETLCRQYEALFVNELLAYVPAGSLHASQDAVGKIEKEALEALLKENQVKTLIMTHVIDGKNRDELVGIGYTASPYNNDYYGYYNFGYTLSANTATVSSYMEFFLETNIYDVESKKLVWSGRKSIFDDRSDLENMGIIIKAVTRDLHRNGMLK
ncbi:hypothetical protein P4B35_13230 [Pontiellaceae bacterium B12227]|nr:hypothetical protein [Pontiellaceae bacterium B12227]